MNVDEAMADVKYLKALVDESRGEMLKQGAPFFLIWGIVWLIGYLMPIAGVPGDLEGPFWFALDALAVVASIVVGCRLQGRHARMPFLIRKWMWSGFPVLGAVVLTLILSLGGQSPFQGTPFFALPLAIGGWYLVGGILTESTGVVLLGLWIAAVSVVAAYLPLPYAERVATLAVFGATAMIGSALYGLRR